MTIYEFWVKSCKKNKTQIIRMEGNPKDNSESGLFLTHTPYEMHGYVFYRSPVYFVWWNGKQKYNGLNYQEALNAWERCNAEEK